MGTTPMIDVFGVSLASRSRSATSRSISSLRLRHTQLLLRGGARTPLEPLEPPRCSAADGDLKKRGDVEQPKTERWENFLVDHLTLESQESIVFSKEQREGPFLKKHFPENGDILTPKAREFWRSTLPNETLLRRHILNPTEGTRDGVGARVKSSAFSGGHTR